MTDQSQRQVEVAAKASSPGIIEHFLIANLHGYRDVSMESPNSAAILISQNGAGKTTLIGALHAVLRGQYARLQRIDFEYLEIKLADQPAQRIYKEDIDEFASRSATPEIVTLAAQIDVKPLLLFEYLSQDFNRADAERAYYNSVTIFDKIVARENHVLSRGLDLAERLALSLYEGNERLREARLVMASALDTVEILYLPTYRRIELALANDETTPRRQRATPDIKFATDSLFTGTIQFGLSDISDQLAQINRDIVNESNNGYRRISASIINDLIGGKFPNQLPQIGSLPSEDELKLFFSRVSQGSRFGPHYPVNVPNIAQIYDNKNDSESNQFLNFFLGYLNDVITVVQEKEFVVTKFIDTCNTYLGSTDSSTELNLGRRYRAKPIDPKELVLDRSDLSVSVRSINSNVNIPLDSLSSGEKQMISLFAKMFLYPSQKIVLIDEPELSLSLDWQTQILPDILAAPSCRQLIAITHSPFVFENCLEPFARAINLTLSNPKHDPLF